MRVFVLTGLVTVCLCQRSNRNNPRPYQGFTRFVETLPQSSSVQDRYFTEDGWDDPGFDGLIGDWGLKDTSRTAGPSPGAGGQGGQRTQQLYRNPGGVSPQRGQGDFKGRPQGDLNAKPQGDFNGRPLGNSNARPQGDFNARTQGDFFSRAQQRGDFNARPPQADLSLARSPAKALFNDKLSQLETQGTADQRARRIKDGRLFGTQAEDDLTVQRASVDDKQQNSGRIKLQDEYKSPVRQEVVPTIPASRNRIKIPEVQEAQVLSLRDQGVKQGVPASSKEYSYYDEDSGDEEEILEENEVVEDLDEEDDMFSEDHPGSLSFGIFSKPKAAVENIKEINSGRPALSSPDVTNTAQTKDPETQAKNSWTDFDRRQEEEEEETLNWNSFGKTAGDKSIAVAEGEKIDKNIRMKIQPKRWNTEFEQFKEKSGLNQPFSLLPTSGDIRRQNENGRQRIENIKRFDSTEPAPIEQTSNYRRYDDIREFPPVLNNGMGTSDESRSRPRNMFKSMETLDASKPQVNQRADYINALKVGSNRSQNIVKQDNNKPAQFGLDETNEFKYSQPPRRNQLISKRPTYDNVYPTNPDLEKKKLDSGLVLPAMISNKGESNKPIQEQSKEGLGSYGPFFNLEFPQQFESSPEPSVSPEPVEEQKAYTAPSFFLPTMFPTMESSAQSTEVTTELVSSNADNEQNINFEKDEFLFSNEDVEDIRDPEQPVSEEVEEISEYVTPHMNDVSSDDFENSSKEPKPEFTDFISSNPEFEDDSQFENVTEEPTETVNIQEEEVVDTAETVNIDEEKVVDTAETILNATVSPFANTFRTRSRVSTVKPESTTADTRVTTTTELSSHDADNLGNLLEENEYSKTHIRLQKTRPRENKLKIATDASPTNVVNNPKDANRYSLTHISKMKTKKNEGGKKDYSKIQVKDIMKKIPVTELNVLLSKNGFQVSDLFRKDPEAMELVFKAMGDEDFLTQKLEEDGTDSKKDELPEETVVEEKNENEDSEYSSDDSPRLSWKPRGKPERKDNPRSIKPSESNNDVKTSVKKEEEPSDEEVESMDVKSLVKRISPMSLSEVLQQTGFALSDIMSGKKNAIIAVLKYHKRKLGQTEETISTEKSKPSPIESMRTTAKLATSTTTEMSTSISSELPSTEPELSSKKKSAIDLFKKFQNKFNPTQSTTTAKSTTTAENMVTGSTYRFGERTTKKRYNSNGDPREDNGENEPSVKAGHKEEKDIFDNPNFRDYLDEDIIENSDISDDIENEVTTATYDSLNITLSSLNMTVSELKERQVDLKVPDLSQIFLELERKKEQSEIIYGGKKQLERDEVKEDGKYEEDEEDEIEQKIVEKKPIEKKDRPKYIQMDFGSGNGGYRGGGNYGNPFSGGSGGWGGAGGLVTNRRTTTTTRTPITYFDVNGERVEDKIDIHSLSEESLLGDYEVSDFYDYDGKKDYDVGDVPEGVKSALIASSVVGGLAVILFLAIFMLCLWKQMKSKLRMSGDFQEEKVGMFSGLFGKKKEKEREPGGFFNKVPVAVDHPEPNYSTTSSEEY